MGVQYLPWFAVQRSKRC